jgi:hypothetical protein
MINECGGLPKVENKINSIGKARRHLLNEERK